MHKNLSILTSKLLINASIEHNCLHNLALHLAELSRNLWRAHACFCQWWRCRWRGRWEKHSIGELEKFDSQNFRTCLDGLIEFHFWIKQSSVSALTLHYGVLRTFISLRFLYMLARPNADSMRDSLHCFTDESIRFILIRACCESSEFLGFILAFEFLSTWFLSRHLQLRWIKCKIVTSFVISNRSQLSSVIFSCSSLLICARAICGTRIVNVNEMFSFRIAKSSS